MAQVKHVARRAWITGWRFCRKAIISSNPFGPYSGKIRPVNYS